MNSSKKIVPPPYELLSVDNSEVSRAKKKNCQLRIDRCIFCMIYTLIFGLIVAGFVYGVLLVKTDRILVDDFQCVYYNTTCDETGVMILFEVGIDHKYELLPFYPDLNDCPYRCCVGEFIRNKLYRCVIKEEIIQSYSSISKFGYGIAWFTIGLILWVGGPIGLGWLLSCCYDINRRSHSK